MSFNYARSRATAERLITRFGQSCTLRQPGPVTGPEYAPVRGQPILTLIEAVDLNVVQRDRDGTLVGEVMRKLYISTSAGVVPAKADEVLVNGLWHEITEIRPLAPGGLDLLFEVDLGTGIRGEEFSEEFSEEFA